jgi:hypothetical protein
MNDITIRFLEVYAYLKSELLVHTPKGFANEINVSTSLITEICKKRTNAGLTPIQNLLIRFEQIDADWLLTGKGSMLKIIKQVDQTNFKELAEARAEIIDGLKYKIASLDKELSELKIQNHDKSNSPVNMPTTTGELQKLK